MKKIDCGRTGVLKFAKGLQVSQISYENPYQHDDGHGAGAVARVAALLCSGNSDLRPQLATCKDRDIWEVLRVFTFGVIADYDDERRDCIRMVGEPHADIDGGGSHSIVQAYETDELSNTGYVAAKICEQILYEMWNRSPSGVATVDYNIYLVTKQVPTEVIGWSEWAI